MWIASDRSGRIASLAAFSLPLRSFSMNHRPGIAGALTLVAALVGACGGTESSLFGGGGKGSSSSATSTGGNATTGTGGSSTASTGGTGGGGQCKPGGEACAAFSECCSG